MSEVTKETLTNWPESTVLCMLDIFKEKHILSHLDHSKFGNSDIFKTVEKSINNYKLIIIIIISHNHNHNAINGIIFS
jgi:hypothetical protein